ncbi:MULTISPECIES: hypothetical protein [unclassified Bradyrhizobium]|uniref:hypothetical protein n=1 Tax=unclassified Bradyrhizobium TaxID=2631580 RepID=UPI00291665CF|nr:MULTISPECIES: hypothetical protein [unclassified Bradyrhizobium]
MDLALFEPPSGLDLKIVDEFAKTRDETLGLIKRQTIFTLLVFVFLLANYLNVGLDVSVAGFSLRYSKGIPEGLLLIANLIACYTIILQANCSMLDATIRSVIGLATPTELQTLYLIRYFPHEHFGRYQPFNMPHLVPSRSLRALTRITAILFVMLLIATTLAFSACNLFLLVYHLWINPSFGAWSTLLLVYILALGFVAILYIALTRLRLPYLDYTVNNELELLGQIDPRRHKMRLQEIYGDLTKDRQDLRDRGYLRKET